MGPTNRAPLPSRTAAGKAMGEMMSGDVALQPPTGSYRRKRAKDEAAARRQAMGDVQAPRAPFAAAPGDNVQVEHARAPAPAAAATEVALNSFEAVKHRGWIECAFHKRYGVGEVAAGAAMSGVEQDRGGVEQPEFLIETRDCSFYDTRRPAVAPVRPVRANGDGIELRCVRHGPSPTAR